MPDYLTVLSDLHQSRRPRTYLEIGVFRGDGLRLASADTLSVGVDPEPVLAVEDEDRWHIEEMTSDDFFAGSRPRELFGSRPVDLVFIDGLHLFEYALRDFFNAERLAGPESLIVLHDVLPIDPVTASRERTTDDWTGDVWKLVLCLLDRRPDLDLSIIDVPPSGLCLVRGVNPEDTTLKCCYEAIVEQYVPLGYEEWEARVADVLERTTRTRESGFWALRRDLDAVRDRLAESAAECASLRGRLAETEARGAALTRQVQAVSASTSWRLTAPLRRVGSMLRRDDGA